MQLTDSIEPNAIKVLAADNLIISTLATAGYYCLPDCSIEPMGAERTSSAHEAMEARLLMPVLFSQLRQRGILDRCVFGNVLHDPTFRAVFLREETNAQ